MLSHFSTSWNLLVGFWVVCKNLSNQVIIVKFVYREEESQSEEAYLWNGLFVICKWKSKSLRPYCSRPIIKQCLSHFVLSLWSCGVYSQLSLRGTTLRPARSALVRACLHGGGVKDSGGSRGEARVPRPPPPPFPYLLTKLRHRKAGKKFFETPLPHVGLWICAPPPNLQVWIRHWKNNPRLHAILQPRHPGALFRIWSTFLTFQHSWALSWLLSRIWAFFPFWATFKHFFLQFSTCLTLRWRPASSKKTAFFTNSSSLD